VVGLLIGVEVFGHLFVGSSFPVSSKLISKFPASWLPARRDGLTMSCVGATKSSEFAAEVSAEMNHIYNLCDPQHTVKSQITLKPCLCKTT
jgi:hypothetical protein